MSEDFEKTDPVMVKMYPKIHAAVIDSLGTQLIEAKARIEVLMAELGEERQMNGILHTGRDSWRNVAELAMQARLDDVWGHVVDAYEEAVRGD